jgi:hypothetical protein
MRRRLGTSAGSCGTATTAKDPLTGKIEQVDQPKEDWVVHERPDIRIILDEDWSAAQRRWQEIDGVIAGGRFLR